MKTVQLTNGVSYCAKIVVEDTDLEEDGTLKVEFLGNSGEKPYYSLGFIPFITDTDGAPKTPTSVVTADSTITIEGVVATDIVTILANRAM